MRCFMSFSHACNRHIRRAIVIHQVFLGMCHSHLALFRRGVFPNPNKHLGPVVQHKNILGTRRLDIYFIERHLTTFVRQLEHTLLEIFVRVLGSHDFIRLLFRKHLRAGTLQLSVKLCVLFIPVQHLNIHLALSLRVDSVHDCACSVPFHARALSALPLHQVKAKIQDVHVTLVQGAVVHGDFEGGHLIASLANAHELGLVLLGRGCLPEAALNAALHDADAGREVG
mmetsp:Transcript_9936/g.13508  ORF Transcript_9936/g.13508 Transcript_9936/m.13508 type:complete len:227 (+) Transcript_9936:132-812(+)